MTDLRSCRGNRGLALGEAGIDGLELTGPDYRLCLRRGVQSLDSTAVGGRLRRDAAVAEDVPV